MTQDCTRSRRAGSIELAAQADPALARDAALHLGGSNATDVNLTAATVLSSTDGTPRTPPRLQELYDNEPSKAAKELYGQALRRVTVQNSVTALERILGLTDEYVPPAVIHAVTPEDGTARAGRIIDGVTQVFVSASPSASIRTFVMECTSLADELMYDGIVAAADAGANMAAAEVDKIRGRRGTNPGSIAHRQAVRETFPWAAHVDTLHQIRPWHTTKAGKATPTVVTEKDRALALLAIGKIAIGWIDAMQKYPSEAP